MVSSGGAAPPAPTRYSEEHYRESRGVRAAERAERDIDAYVRGLEEKLGVSADGVGGYYGSAYGGVRGGGGEGKYPYTSGFNTSGGGAGGVGTGIFDVGAGGASRGGVIQGLSPTGEGGGVASTMTGDNRGRDLSVGGGGVRSCGAENDNRISSSSTAIDRDVVWGAAVSHHRGHRDASWRQPAPPHSSSSLIESGGVRPPRAKVGLCKLDQFDPWLERRIWFQLTYIVKMSN